MKSIFKKALVTTGLVAMMATSANAVDNEIAITGVVNTTVVVGFNTGVSGTNGIFVGETVDMGNADAGAALGAVTKDIYVLTNNGPGSITMALSDGAGFAGALVGGGANIPVAYTLGGAPYVPDTTAAVTIVTGVSDGATIEDALVITPAANAADQVAGTYTTTLTVTIAAI